MAKLKWHNGPTFTSGPIYKTGGNSQVAPGAEYERRGRVLTPGTWNVMTLGDLCSELEESTEAVTEALAKH